MPSTVPHVKTDDATLEALRIAVEGLALQGHPTELLAIALKKLSVEFAVASRSPSGNSTVTCYMPRSA